MLWVNTQIYNYNQNRLTKEQILLLNNLGIQWNQRELAWDEMFLQAKDYYVKNCNKGYLKISDDLEYANLKRWIRKQCDDYKKGNNSFFTNERIDKLESIGMGWDEFELAWDENYDKAADHYSKYKSLDVTLIGVGTELYSWIRSQRRLYKMGKLNDEKIKKLENIGMIWDASHKAVKVSFPEKALYYYLSMAFNDVITSEKQMLGGRELDLYIPSINTAIEYDGVYYHIDRWEEDIEKCIQCKNARVKLIRIREKGLKTIDESLCDTIFREDQSNNALEVVINELLQRLGVKVDVCLERDHHDIADLVNNVNSPFDKMYNEAKLFYDTFGHLRVPTGYKTKDGRNLYTWISRQRSAYFGKDNSVKISNYNILRLEHIGMVWDVKDEKWKIAYELLTSYYNKNHNLLVPRSYIVDGFALGQYVHYLRQQVHPIAAAISRWFAYVSNELVDIMSTSFLCTNRRILLNKKI